MTWEHKSFPAKTAPAAEMRTPDGVRLVVPSRSLPRRESFLATSSAADWEAVERDLVDYWGKVADVLPRYYAARGAADPLAGEPVSPDAGWDRLVFILDPLYGKVTTNLWAGGEPPTTSDRAWVIVKFPMIEAITAKGGKTSRATLKRMGTALAWAAEHPAAVDAISRLRAWREMSFWVMDAEAPETCRPMLGG